ncbi:MAG: hypothetical protein Ta2B_01330 [Termitinemataceae bacterium]|nr:MAG: hypothetical protein Ta2B_01330 [Termitinemataceae bacterium]
MIKIQFDRNKFTILFFLTLIASTALVVRPLQKTILKNFEAIKSYYIEKVEGKINKNITYGSIGPSIFGTIDIKNISILSTSASTEISEDDEFPDIHIKKLVLKYSVSKVLQLDFLKSIRSIKIVQPSIDINTEKELLDLFKGDGLGGNINGKIKKFCNIIPSDAAIRITNGDVRLKAGNSNAYFSNFSIRANVTEGTLNLAAAWNADTLLNGFTKNPFTVMFPCKLDARYNISEGIGNVKIYLSALRTKEFTIHDLRLEANINDENLFVKKTNMRNVFDLSFFYNLVNSDLRIDAYFNKFNPATFITWNDTMHQINSWQRINLSGDIKTTISKENGILYNADLSGICLEASTQGPGNFLISASGNGHKIDIKNIIMDLNRGKMDIKGSLNIDNMSPNANITLEKFVFTKSESGTPVSGSLIVTSSQNRINLFCDTLEFGNTPLSAFDAIMRRSPKGFDLTLQALRFTGTESYTDVSISHIDADLSFNKDEKEFQLEFALESFAMSDVLEIVSAFAIDQEISSLVKTGLSNVILTTEIFASYDFVHLVYNVPRFITAAKGSRTAWATSSLSGTEEFISVTDGRFITKNSTARFDARADFENINDIIFSADLFWINSSYLVQGNILDKRNISITSEQGLSASITLEDAGRISGFLVLDDLQLPLSTQVLAINCVSDFRWNSPDSWSFDLDKLDFSTYSHVFSKNSNAEFEAHANQDGAQITRVIFDDGRGALFGDAYVKWDRIADASGKTIYTNVNGQGNLRNLSGEETISIDVSSDQNSLLVWAKAEDFQSGRIFSGSSNFLITGDIGFFQNPFEAWSCAFDLTSLTGRFGGSDIVITTRGSLDEQRLEIGKTNISFADLNVEFPFLSLVIDQHRIDTSASVSGVAGGGANVNADISIRAEFSEVNSWLGIGNILKSIEGSISFENVRFDTVKLEDAFTVNFSRYANVISIAGGPDNMMRIQMNSAGDFFAAFSNPSPVKGTIIGIINNDKIDLRTSNLVINISQLWSYVPIKYVGFSSGIIIANLHIKGPLLNPEFFGSAFAANLKFNLPGYAAEEIGPTPAVINFSGNEMILEEMYTAVGSDGACFITGGFIFDRWVPKNFSLEIKIPSDTPIPLDLDISGFLATGKAYGTFNLSKDEVAMHIGGNIYCEEAELTMDSKDKDANKNKNDSGNSSNLQVDISITAGNKVEFLWPNTTMPIIRANAASGSQLSIATDSLAGHFALKGDINIKSGEIFYFQRSFYIREGSLNFNESEINFDPHITARAEARDMTNNEPVTISMVINDQSLTNFSPTLESNPPLSQIEILALMGEKLVGTSGEDNTISTAFLSSATDMLAQFYVVRKFEKTLRNIMHVDMFSVRTQALQNAVFLNLPTTTVKNASKNSSGLPTDTIASTSPTANGIRFGNYFDNTTVYIGKYITKSVFAQMMISARYDEDQIEWGGLKLQPDFSMEFQAPSFNIRWDLIPQHPETFYVADNKITLTKKWTLP